LKFEAGDTISGDFWAKFCPKMVILIFGLFSRLFIIPVNKEASLLHTSITIAVFSNTCVITLIIYKSLLIPNSMDKHLLPLGYPTPFQLISNYAHQHNLQKTETVESNGKKHTEETIDEAYVVFIACERAGAGEVEWVASYGDLTYLQVSGGGGEHEWRISEDMENRLRREFGFVDEPMRFEPDGWMPFCVRVGRDPN
jgi:hypothetical protein